MSVKYTEENLRYVIDCSLAVWSTDRLNSYYQNPEHLYGKVGFLSDVDWIIENEKNIFLVEYKNASIPNAVHPDAFKPDKAETLIKVARKYYDSYHWLYLAGKQKPAKFIYILEYPAGNSTSRLMIRNKLKEHLPFALQKLFAVAGQKLIEEVKVLSIKEWNEDEELGMYPIAPR